MSGHTRLRNVSAQRSRRTNHSCNEDHSLIGRNCEPVTRKTEKMMESFKHKEYSIIHVNVVCCFNAFRVNKTIFLFVFTEQLDKINIELNWIELNI